MDIVITPHHDVTVVKIHGRIVDGAAAEQLQGALKELIREKKTRHHFRSRRSRLVRQLGHRNSRLPLRIGCPEGREGPTPERQRSDQDTDENRASRRPIWLGRRPRRRLVLVQTTSRMTVLLLQRKLSPPDRANDAWLATWSGSESGLKKVRARRNPLRSRRSVLERSRCFVLPC